MIKYKTVVEDDHEVQFGADEATEFAEYVKERAAAARWVDPVAAKELKVEAVMVNEDESVFDKADEYNASAEALEDTIFDGTKLAVCHPGGEKILLRPNALVQVKQRLCIEGSAFNAFSPEQTAEVLNIAASVNSKKVLMRVADEKCTGFLSALSYAVIDSTDVFDEAQTCLGNSADFRTGFFSHTFLEAQYDLHDTPERKRALQKYRDLLGDDYALAASVRTSDTGNCAVTLAPRLVKKSNRTFVTMPLGNDLRVEHKGKKTMEQIHEIFNELEASLDAGAERLEKLSNIDLNYPTQALMRALKKVQVPAKQAMEVVGKFLAVHGENPATALELYVAAQDCAMKVAMEEGNSSMKTYRVQEALARLLGVRWSDLDYPGDLVW